VALGPLASIDPLSAGRYRVQFTADAALKQQLELARDLLRHANPSGDFAAIISRALELLLDDLSRSRFGARAARKVPVPPRPANAAQQSGESRRSAAERSTTGLDPSGSTPTKAEQASRPSTAADPPSAAPGLAEPPISSPDRVEPQPTPPRRAVRRTTRRAVIERDGLGCSWVGEDGMRCGSQAWLEFDHREPAGKGGSSALDNVRLLCRAHNGLSAEQHYGRAHISRAIRRRRQRQTPRKAASPADYE
jgi:5-methylcytosine-specific restriction endonuclease McrA